MNRSKAALAFVVALLAPSALLAADGVARPIGDTQLLALVGQGYPEGLVVEGNTAFVAGPAAFGNAGKGPSSVSMYDTRTGAYIGHFKTRGEDLSKDHALSCITSDGDSRLYVLSTQLGVVRIDPRTDGQDVYATVPVLPACNAFPPGPCAPGDVACSFPPGPCVSGRCTFPPGPCEPGTEGISCFPPGPCAPGTEGISCFPPGPCEPGTEGISCFPPGPCVPGTEGISCFPPGPCEPGTIGISCFPPGPCTPSAEGLSCFPPGPCAPVAVNRGSLVNDLAFDDEGNLYITDSFQATIFRVPSGGGVAEPWYQDPAFDTSTIPGFSLGLNGLRVSPDRSQVFFDVSFGEAAGMWTLPRVDAPSPAELEQFYAARPGDIMDGMAFDSSGNLFVALAGANQIQVLQSAAGVFGGAELGRFPTAAANAALRIPFDNPANIAFNGRGSILVANHAIFGNPADFAVLDSFVASTGSPLARPIIR